MVILDTQLTQTQKGFEDKTEIKSIWKAYKEDKGKTNETEGDRIDGNNEKEEG
jgi:hypothetical protein